MNGIQMRRVVAILAVAVVVFGCASTTVKRTDVEETIDLSGRWNDSDSRMVSEEMIRDCLDRPWLERYKARHNEQIPTVIVGRVRNRSHEHINVQTFVKDLERSLINSGQVRFVAAKDEREGVREERLDMAGNATEDTMKGPGQEIGADYMLIGTLNSIRDEISGKAVMYYQVNLELIDMESNVKVWIGEKKIKKLIERSKLTW